MSDVNNNLENNPVNNNEKSKEENMENTDITTSGSSIHPLSEDLKDATFLNESDALIVEETIATPVAPKDANIGALLKRVREEKGHSLKLVSQQTKIHLALLEALEDNQLIRLPSKTYVKGFVKAYAKLLNIPQADAIESFENTYREYEGLPPISETKSTTAPLQSKVEEMPSRNLKTPEKFNELANVASHNGGMLLKVGLGLFLVVVIGINIKSMIERSMEEKSTDLPEVISTTTKPKKSAPVTTQAPETLPTSAELAAATATTNTTPATPAVNLITKDAIKPDVKINDEVTLKAISAVEKQHKDITLSKEELDQYLPVKYRITPPAGTETLFINAAHGDSWLTYKTDGNDIKKFVLRQGRTLYLRGQEIRIFIGNTKSLKVFHNNKPVELLTPTGVKNAVYPEKLKTKYMNPLFVFQKDGTVITSEEAVEKMKTPAQTTTTTAPLNGASPTPLNNTKFTAPPTKKIP